MSENTKIEWADHTFNPWIGCTQISPACDNCYAKAWDRRFAVSGHAMHWGAGVARKRTSIANWRLPIKWNKQAALMQSGWEHGVVLHGGDEAACIAAGFIKPVQPKVFCASMADVFDNAVPAQWRMDLFSLIIDTPNIDWLILTKRISNAKGMISEAVECPMDMMDILKPLPNVWLGATICNQEEANRDIPKLLAVPAAKRFLSMEPLLESVTVFDLDGPIDVPDGMKSPIDWVIVGGESGPNARPMHPDWARSLRDQCEAAGVPFLFKQWGEWAPTGPVGAPDIIVAHDGRTCEFSSQAMADLERGGRITPAQRMYRTGKKAAGRLLDGREWNGVPA